MVTHERWLAIRSSLEKVHKEFAGMVAAADPGRMATAHWNAADTAAHVTAIAAMYTALLHDGLADDAFPEVGDAWRASTVDTVHHFNAATLRVYRERRVPYVLDRLDAEVGELLRASADVDFTSTRPWLGDSRVPVAGLLAHLMNELHIHGWDVARANRLPWTIDPADAAHFPEAFLTGVIGNGYGHLVDGGGPPSERRITVQFRSRHTTTTTFALHRGVVSVERPRADDDVRLTFDPTTLNLMLFGRISHARAALTRRVRVSGPRPWLLPRFMKTVRLPSGQGQAT
ncbi:hypothetical protein V2S66_04075 [Streptomyces sp. V4-01]|uniref:Mycothiol-dependent maleylpyruvate isomerase metal-binding domain-containing protein n=1 Tax=Actinacidiphila polyblastidii TaxID=3110430 RepID=A0ABU7P5Q7_9ACTN|nr:hypothetical protein [Streptomyces sp. V4-01]